MVIEDLLTQIKAKGLVPVRVEEGFSAFENEVVRRPIFAFDGALGEFLDTAVALKVKAIFVSVSGFEGTEFLYRVGPPQNLDGSGRWAWQDDRWAWVSEPIRRGSLPVQSEDRPPLIDLSQREPSLAPWREHIGDNFEYELEFSCADVILSLSVQEDWYWEFEELRRKVRRVIDEERDQEIMAQIQKLAEDKKKKEEEYAAYLSALKQTLIQDESLMSLPPNEGMTRAYLLEKYPEATSKLAERTNEIVFWMKEEISKKRASERQKRTEIVSGLRQTLSSDDKLPRYNGISLQQYYLEELRYYLNQNYQEASQQLDDRGLEELVTLLREDWDKKRASERDKQNELVATLQQILVKDEAFLSLPTNDKITLRDYLDEKYPAFATKLDEHVVGALVYSLRDDFEKQRRARQLKREAERRQQEEEAEKFYEECEQKLATLKQTLPSDAALMSLTNKTSMRAYLLDTHPELFGTLITSRRQQEDFINWLYLQKQKKRS